MHLAPTVAKAAVRSMMVVLLLLIHWLLLLPLFVGVLYFVLVLLFSTLFCNHLDGDERAGCFTLIVFLVSFDYYCSEALPRLAVGWSAVFDCGISWSYSLAI